MMILKLLEENTRYLRRVVEIEKAEKMGNMTQALNDESEKLLYRVLCNSQQIQEMMSKLKQ
ncbi:hypothetical protein [Vibrio hangzhouensis]|uniref:Uncharacterized protein n=1 Tax=Vibrio hangzhouensis TaxID=462991 RepID=A0A1H5RT45_9VIBR|nr:hypothetical protein [Vibrio hangzhouensis]SEF41284.1 hypothetical protein SAMN04488244_101101 [Vibrio hangzhouensis]